MFIYIYIYVLHIENSQLESRLCKFCSLYLFIIFICLIFNIGIPLLNIQKAV